MLIGQVLVPTALPDCQRGTIYACDSYTATSGVYAKQPPIMSFNCGDASLLGTPPQETEMEAADFSAVAAVLLPHAVNYQSDPAVSEAAAALAYHLHRVNRACRLMMGKAVHAANSLFVNIRLFPL